MSVVERGFAKPGSGNPRPGILLLPSPLDMGAIDLVSNGTRVIAADYLTCLMSGYLLLGCNREMSTTDKALRRPIESVYRFVKI